MTRQALQTTCQAALPRHTITESMPAPTPNPGPNPDFEPEQPDSPVNSPEIDPETQPRDEDGVTEDMASLAINPMLLENLHNAEKVPASGEFGQMDDAAIMLQLSAGNMAGF